MPEDSTQQSAYDATQQEVNDKDLQEKIKQITLKALTERQLDKENIKSVVEQVISGVNEGFTGSGERLKPAMEASLRGIDDALAKSAIAAKLAAEEVLSKTEKFAQQDVKQVCDDLNTIEGLLFDSINQVATRSSDLASNTLHELSEHFKKSGTEVGKTSLEAIQSLTSAIEASGKQGLNEVSHSSKDLASKMAQVASGILAGMSEAIKPKDKP